MFPSKTKEPDMIQLILLLLVALAILMLLKMAKSTKSQKATLEEARTLGLQEASLHINNPILFEDYAQAKGLTTDVLITLIEEGKMPFYEWRGYTFVENRELAHARK